MSFCGEGRQGEKCREDKTGRGHVRGVVYSNFIKTDRMSVNAKFRFGGHPTKVVWKATACNSLAMISSFKKVLNLKNVMCANYNKNQKIWPDFR